ALDADPLGLAAAAGGADEERAFGAQAVDCDVLPLVRHAREDADRAAPALQEHVLERSRGRKRRLDHRAGLAVEGIGLASEGAGSAGATWRTACRRRSSGRSCRSDKA